MVGASLAKIRDRIESLESEDGRFCVVCGRTGVSPVPVTGCRFPDRAPAESAAQAATTYRAALRRWDPRAPCYDFIACEVPAQVARKPYNRTDVTVDETAEDDDGVGPAAAGDAVAGIRHTAPRANSLTGACHDIAAAIFETLSAQGHQAVESALMDAYCGSADVIEDPDELCLHLLRTLAVELDERLGAEAFCDLLRGAAGKLSGPVASERPIVATLERLRAVGFIEGYIVEPTIIQPFEGRSWSVTVSEYALTQSSRTLPTLPIAVELLRRLPEMAWRLADARRVDTDCWRFRVTETATGPTEGLGQVRAEEL
jgi:hypothetical protein